MQPEDVQAMLRAEPYLPLQVRLKNGKSYDLIYPNLVMVTRPSLVIAFPDPASNGRWGDDYIQVAWPDIAAVEPLTTAEAVA